MICFSLRLIVDVSRAASLGVKRGGKSHRGRGGARVVGVERER